MQAIRIKVLFVCLGNICRSPMAEGVFRHLVEQARLEDLIECDSAGTSDYHIGDLPDRRMRQTAARQGISLTHCARQFEAKDFTRFDYIIAMDGLNLKDILSHSACKPAYAGKVRLMCSFGAPAKASSGVPDPYYGKQEDFEEVYQLMLRASQNLLEYLISHHSLKNKDATEERTQV